MRARLFISGSTTRAVSLNGSRRFSYKSSAVRSEHLRMWIALWIICALLVGAHAARRGFSPVAAFLLSMLLSPLVGWLIVTLRQPEARAVSELLQEGGHKQCPACAEAIRLEALKCRYCGEQLDPASCQPPAPYSGKTGYRAGYVLGRLLRGK